MKNTIINVVQDFEQKYFVRFCPKKEFYKKIKTGQKLWKKFLNNEAQPNAEQILLICEVFKVIPEDVVKLPKQTELFKPDYEIIKISKNKIEDIKNFSQNKLGSKQQEDFLKIFDFLNIEK